MTVQVTLDIPDKLLAKAERYGDITQQDLGGVLADALEIVLPMIDDTPDSILNLPIKSLSDEDVLKLADSKMDVQQNQRLGDLQSKGKTLGLSAAERYELMALLQIYQLGQLRKSEALAEAVSRGLRAPLSA
jgi:hypothetical protein